MYLKSQTKSLFINLHEFVLTPGVFENLFFFYENLQIVKVKEPRLLLILILLLIMIVVKE